jgi:hypothetical protein
LASAAHPEVQAYARRFRSGREDQHLRNPGPRWSP